MYSSHSSNDDTEDWYACNLSSADRQLCFLVKILSLICSWLRNPRPNRAKPQETGVELSFHWIQNKTT